MLKKLKGFLFWIFGTMRLFQISHFLSEILFSQKYGRIFFCGLLRRRLQSSEKKRSHVSQHAIFELLKRFIARKVVRHFLWVFFKPPELILKTFVPSSFSEIITVVVVIESILSVQDLTADWSIVVTSHTLQTSRVLLVYFRFWLYNIRLKWGKCQKKMKHAIN